MKKKEDLFYCYSPKLFYFAKACDTYSEDYYINDDGNPCWTFKKDNRFNKVLKMYKDFQQRKIEFGLY